MKSQRGITMISLSINVIVLLITVGIISVISGHFYSNYNKVSTRTPQLEGYTNFISCFSQDVNNKEAKVLLCETTVNNYNKTSYIVFNNKVQYTFIEENQAIYQNKIKIVEDVEDCEFSTNSDKTQINVYMKFLGDYEVKQLTYSIRN